MNKISSNPYKKISRISFLGLLIISAFSIGWFEPKALNEKEGGGVTVLEDAKSVSVVSEGEKIDSESSDFVIKERRQWSSPDFSNQNGALGWSSDAFMIPQSLAERVEFWKDVYTKYTTNQGFLHDSQYVNLIYDHIDFSEIMSDPKLSDRQKQKARHKLVNFKKNEIKDRLQKLAQIEKEFKKTQVQPQLEGEDLRIWNLFAPIDEKDKFHAALHRKRLRFQLGQRDRFIQGIYYSGRYLAAMEKVFREKGLPIELTRLPFVESSFNVKARSRVGASGIWQFMRYTGRKFLKINYAVDERNDPVRATEAAARLLRLNFDMLGKWPLAVTGWNHGPAGVQRMIRRYDTDNIADLVDARHGRFGFASANFYSCFLAALEVEKNASKYFGPIYWDVPDRLKEVTLARKINTQLLQKWFKGDVVAAKEANPQLQKSFWLGFTSVGEKAYVRVPEPQFESAMRDISSMPKNPLQTAQNNSGELDQYMIEQGETLSQIASQLGIKMSVLLELNGIDNPRRIRAGQKILVPHSQ